MSDGNAWPPPKPGEHESDLVDRFVCAPELPGELLHPGRGGVREFHAAREWSRENAAKQRVPRSEVVSRG